MPVASMHAISLEAHFKLLNKFYDIKAKLFSTMQFSMRQSYPANMTQCLL